MVISSAITEGIADDKTDTPLTRASACSGHHTWSGDREWLTEEANGGQSRDTVGNC